MQPPLSRPEGPTVQQAALTVVAHPWRIFVVEWNWKAALLSAIFRGAFFLGLAVPRGPGAMRLVWIELAFRAVTGGSRLAHDEGAATYWNLETNTTPFRLPDLKTRSRNSHRVDARGYCGKDKGAGVIRAGRSDAPGLRYRRNLCARYRLAAPVRNDTHDGSRTRWERPLTHGLLPAGLGAGLLGHHAAELSHIERLFEFIVRPVAEFPVGFSNLASVNPNRIARNGEPGKLAIRAPPRGLPGAAAAAGRLFPRDAPDRWLPDRLRARLARGGTRIGQSEGTPPGS